MCWNSGIDNDKGEVALIESDGEDMEAAPRRIVGLVVFVPAMLVRLRLGEIVKEVAPFDSVDSPVDARVDSAAGGDDSVSVKFKIGYV